MKFIILFYYTRRVIIKYNLEYFSFQSANILNVKILNENHELLSTHERILLTSLSFNEVKKVKKQHKIKLMLLHSIGSLYSLKKWDIT